MDRPEGERKLAAILSADVAGYSRLMGDDERATVRTLTEYREMFRDHIERHRGRVVDAPGDNLLAAVASPVEAVQCAADVQRELARRNDQLADHRRMDFRVGINLGDVIAQDGALFGDGVNIAARLESLAEPGGICVSESVHYHVRNKLELGFDDLGEQQVKNIAEPVRAYRVDFDAGETRAQSTAATSEPERPSIAVLPFTNMSGDPEQEYFSDGITEDLITRLSMFPDYLIIARNTTFRYKGKAVNVTEIANELGVHFVLEGSVRRSANRIRITAQLIDSRTGGHIWAETFDRDLSATDIFDIQDDITERVAASVGDSFGVISLAGYEQSKSQSPNNLAAYEFVLGAHGYYASNFTPSEHARVRDGLEKAVESDPNYADAWAWLAAMYRDEYVLDWNVRPRSLERAEAAALHALELQPNNQEGHLVLADVHYFRHDLDGFFTQAERTLSINPNSVDAMGSMGTRIAYGGRWDQGVALIKKGMRLNPKFPVWFHHVLFYDHYRKDEFEDALSQARKAVIPGFYWSYLTLSAAYGMLDRTTDARRATDELLKLMPGFNLQSAAGHYRKWNFAESLITKICDGLRKAGLGFPD